MLSFLKFVLVQANSLLLEAGVGQSRRQEWKENVKKTLLSKFDSDGDGQISQSEFMNNAAAMLRTAFHFAVPEISAQV